NEDAHVVADHLQQKEKKNTRYSSLVSLVPTMLGALSMLGLPGSSQALDFLSSSFCQLKSDVCSIIHSGNCNLNRNYTYNITDIINAAFVRASNELNSSRDMLFNWSFPLIVPVSKDVDGEFFIMGDQLNRMSKYIRGNMSALTDNNCTSDIIKIRSSCLSSPYMTKEVVNKYCHNITKYLSDSKDIDEKTIVTTEESNTKTWALICALTLFLLIAGVVMFLVRRRHKSRGAYYMRQNRPLEIELRSLEERRTSTEEEN
ncbi:putative membrane protein (partial), partial [Candidatus Ichthyocystis hellenicum]